MGQKNVPLFLAVLLAAIVVLKGAGALWSSFLPAWPGYGSKEYIRFNAPVIALTHVRVIDGTGAPPADDANVVISNGKIQAVGSAATTPVPAGANIFNGAGYSVIPGLVGMHDHLFYGGVRGTAGYAESEMGFAFPRLYLANGVTTIRTAGAIAPYTDLRLKQQIDRGWVIGPKIVLTGPYMQFSTAASARESVNYWADRGVTWFKAYMHITEPALRAAIEAAHRRGLRVTGHLCAVRYDDAVAMGIDNLEHGLLEDTEFDPGTRPDICPPQDLTDSTLAGLDVDGPQVQGLIRDLITHNVAITSTLPVFETFVPFRAPEDPRALQVLDARTLEDYREVRGSTNERGDSSRWPVLLKKEMEFERAFVQAGGLLLAGEDPTGNGGNLAGFGDQREVELLVEAGFTPLEAIHIVTSNGAAFLGRLTNIGTLENGKQADLVVVKGDPSTRISDIENVETVFKDGIGYESAKLIESVRESVSLH
jgi:imidazolonepropionase-like amidohydrolase